MIDSTTMGTAPKLLRQEPRLPFERLSPRKEIAMKEPKAPRMILDATKARDLSRSDVLVHDREQVHHLAPPEYYHGADLATEKELAEGFQIEEVDQTLIKDIMTPVVYSVLPETPATEVINQMVGLKVHRLFVVDPDGVLVGVISTVDILRHLQPENDVPSAPVTSAGKYAPHYAEIW